MKFPPKFIIVMDADYSHDPKVIPRLLSKMQDNCDVVVGSRYCSGGEIAGWSCTRKIVSRAANIVAKFLVGLKLDDCTSGFRCYSTGFVRATIGGLQSQTYEIQIETLRQAFLRGFRIKETPILFVNRKLGKSKLSLTEIQSYFLYVFETVLRGRNRL